jgi:hypothetical protein
MGSSLELSIFSLLPPLILPQFLFVFNLKITRETRSFFYSFAYAFLIRMMSNISETCTHVRTYTSPLLLKRPCSGQVDRFGPSNGLPIQKPIYLELDPSKTPEDMDPKLYKAAVEEYHAEVKQNPEGFKAMLQYKGY